MASVLKVDQIQSDTGIINVASKIEFPVGSASAPSISPTGDTNTGIFFPAADTIAFAEGGAEAVRIDSDGDVGIGTTSPSEKLDVIANSSGPDGAIRVRTQFGSGYFGAVGNYPAFGYKTGGVLYAALAYDTNNNFLFTGPESAKQPAYLCRAWVNFNGTGTVAIRGSGNVSSITDRGTGQYTVNFSTSMPDSNYTAFCQSGNDASNTTNVNRVNPYSRQTSSFLIDDYDGGVEDGGTTLSDRQVYYIGVFR